MITVSIHPKFHMQNQASSLSLQECALHQMKPSCRVSTDRGASRVVPIIPIVDGVEVCEVGEHVKWENGYIFPLEKRYGCSASHV